MRIMLKAVVLVGALVSTGLMSMEAAQAVEKAKAKAVPAAAKGKPPTGVGKAKVDPVVQKAVAKPVVAKGKTGPQARQQAKTVSLARHSAAPLAHKAAPAHGNGGYSHVVHKKGVNRVFAGNVDLWQEPGQLAVQSGSALVIPQDGGEPLYEKNANAVVPIASITKVMTAMVVLDSLPNLQAAITISDEDVDYLRGSRSRLQVGTVIPRETALLLALMSSENRAANALGRHYPGGLQAFVAAMNRKASSLGMSSSHFEDPTGLNSNNVSTARDLARMVAAAHRYPLIREFSTTSGARAEVKGRELEFHNTNQLVSSPTWEIGLSKTGYIQEAGKCLVMQARVADRPVVIVLLDSAGKQTRIGDAIRIKRWMESASASSRLPTHV
ncbi:Peptidase S11 D-alanyl-D-alanine carboxypeptidase 1 [Candidatus Accumulibacter aalborgensis]|uniref:Peptidase S11 D-alanyl-D-alanine carboxypeptidase 1 n=1 Tax=Candidatus Accumulibacter aalborgensis TaxID=1860102 RepID=A0A1A8XGP4_9PROT|nr:D-alanyl-D-alanine endopeptidase [Candidatus Accumulibacter aalborgensis]SBT03537.1 Peptidase S11 D-alanyl-D-alanine carboxypeptidase 1 [Candidatus Accumulibacter aalborgensis]